MGLLDGKVAVVTGAGSGMAKASVQVFVREGAKVVAGDISGAEKDVASELGDAVVPVHCDVTNEDDVEALVRAAVEIVPAPVRSPRYQPLSMGPTDSAMAGMLTVAAAISWAGVVLSQPVMSTTPSSG